MTYVARITTPTLTPLHRHVPQSDAHVSRAPCGQWIRTIALCVSGHFERVNCNESVNLFGEAINKLQSFSEQFIVLKNLNYCDDGQRI